MVDDTAPPDPSDDLAAFDFFAPTNESTASDLDALDAFAEYRTAHDESDPDAVETFEPPVDDAPADEQFGPTFTVTNPPGTVTVTTLTDGRVQRVDISQKASTMTEAHLAEEIVVIATLATQEARAAQYEYMLDGMRQQGHDDVATRDFLRRDLDLPSPDDAVAARAHVFTTRYAGEE